MVQGLGFRGYGLGVGGEGCGVTPPSRGCPAIAKARPLDVGA
jgi:hypothetical protein